MRAAILLILVLIAVAAAPAAHINAQGCEDCEIIKKGVPEATPGAAAPASAPSTAALVPTEPVVRAVLYWTEECGNCHEVLAGLLPQMQQQYGAQLEVRLVEVVTMEDISAFFDVAETYGFARGRAAVPFLLIGDRALMGVEQITAGLPALIETYLVAGGVEWPSGGRAEGTPGGAEGWTPLSEAAEAESCTLAEPCIDEPTATLDTSDTETNLPGSLVAPVLAAIGVVAVTGGALAVFLRRRASHRALLASHPAHTSTPIHGDNDAKT